MGDGARSIKFGGASFNTYVFSHFVSKEELIASKVIPLPCMKLTVRVSYLFAILEKYTKIELADHTAERC